MKPIRGASATYSPEDNKIRLSFPSRLSAEDYAEVKGAGFIWAAKQELFVAPAWSPDRADFAVAVAGTIDDEGTSLADRAAQRAERFDDYADARGKEATRAQAAVAAIADNIPLGQPILVGHHSERHARRDAERIQNGMRRAVQAYEAANYWKNRAAASVAAAEYKELPAVRARRIKKIESEERAMKRTLAEYTLGARFWRGELKYKKNGESHPLEITEENKTTICEILGSSPFGNLNVNGTWSAWDVLRPEGERYKACPEMTVAEVQALALGAYERGSARCSRWLDHYAGRLEYERAMLAESGGTVADRTGPEVGGACRCWASPSGGWSLIQKVNKVSVTLLDNWGNGGRDFTRTIPFDKLSAVMTKAQVDEARAVGRILGETPLGFILRADAPAPAPEPKPAPTPDPADENLAALRATLKAGVQVVSAPNLFPTPPDLAARMILIADIRPGMAVLEPSAGTGRLLDAMPSESIRFAVEINADLASALQARGIADNVMRADFLEITLAAYPRQFRGFDRVVMNPPFYRGTEIEHVKHAMSFLKPGGRLVALVADGARKGELEDLGFVTESLGAGLFEGTGVAVALAVYDKPTPKPEPPPVANRNAEQFNFALV